MRSEVTRIHVTGYITLQVLLCINMVLKFLHLSPSHEEEHFRCSPSTALPLSFLSRVFDVFCCHRMIIKSTLDPVQVNC